MGTIDAIGLPRLLCVGSFGRLEFGGIPRGAPLKRRRGLEAVESKKFQSQPFGRA